jgi:hypothetical protein
MKWGHFYECQDEKRRKVIYGLDSEKTIRKNVTVKPA